VFDVVPANLIFNMDSILKNTTHAALLSFHHIKYLNTIGSNNFFDRSLGLFLDIV